MNTDLNFKLPFLEGLKVLKRFQEHLSNGNTLLVRPELFPGYEENSKVEFTLISDTSEFKGKMSLCHFSVQVYQNGFCILN